MKNLIFVFVFAVICTTINAQFANVWKLGNGFGLDFNSASPTVITSPYTNQADNSSSICDVSGNLLFYTNGINVWNKNNVVMPNGSGLTGHVSAGQCALIVPMPCNPNKYVIFHVTEFSNPGYLSYTVVDMTLNSGLGDVVSGQKNISLGSGWTEKLCAYYSNTANCYWVLTHKWMSDQFVAFKVDASSIATTSVVSAIGSIHNCGSYGGAHDAMGQLTISRDGGKVVNALTCQDKFEFFDFNITTGVLSNSISITGNGGNAWGTAFSPDSKKVYVSSIFGSSVYQYDLSTYNSSAILASLTNIYNTGSGGYNFGYMELGPDGKIYMPQPNTNSLSVINSPNNLGSACNFGYGALSLTSGSAQWGMCRTAYNIPMPQQPFAISASSSNITCFGMANGSGTVSPSIPGSYTYTWSPGSYSTSVANNLTAGNYTVTVSDGTCTTTSTVLTISQPQPVSLSITSSTLICNGNSAILNSTVSGGTPAYTYSWSNGSIFSGTSVTPNVQTTYTLIVNDANSCNTQAVTTVSVSDCTGISENTNELSITIYPNPTNNYLHIDTKLKYDEILLTNVIGKIIRKYNGSQRDINVSDLQDGIYFITISNNKNTIITKKIVKSD